LCERAGEATLWRVDQQQEARLTLDRLDALVVLEVLGVHASRDDVVREELDEGGLVLWLEQVLKDMGRELLEGSVGWREDREGARARPGRCKSLTQCV
jgi:hypothetical protein